MMCVSIISSQIYRDEQIILDKMKQDYLFISVSPPFLKDGILTMVLIDGHHSFDASKRTGQQPFIDIINEDIEAELLFDGEIDWFLDWHKSECDWYEIGIIEGVFDPVN